MIILVYNIVTSALQFTMNKKDFSGQKINSYIVLKKLNELIPYIIQKTLPFCFS